MPSAFYRINVKNGRLGVFCVIFPNVACLLTITCSPLRRILRHVSPWVYLQETLSLCKSECPSLLNNKVLKMHFCVALDTRGLQVKQWQVRCGERCSRPRPPPPPNPSTSFTSPLPSVTKRQYLFLSSSRERSVPPLAPGGGFGHVNPVR